MREAVTVPQRLLRHHDMLEDPSVLNLFYAIGLDGPLDKEALGLALASLPDAFPELGQAPDAKQEIPKLIDLSDVKGEVAERRLLELIEEEKRRPHNTFNDSLMRAVLVKFDPRKHLLLLSFHHAAADGWSLGLYANHVNSAYAAVGRGDAVPIPTRVQAKKPGPSMERLEKQRRALRGHLDGVGYEVLDPFGMPSGKPTPQFWSTIVDDEFVVRLHATATSHRATPFGLVVTAVAQQLQSMFGLPDVLLGTTVHGRKSSVEMNSGGAFYQGALLPFRRSDLNISGVSRTIAAAMDRVLDYEEQIEILSEAVGRPAGDPSVFVVSDRHPLGALQFSDVEVSMVSLSDQTSASPKAAHSPSCGRVTIFWRQGLKGASLTVFSEPSLVAVARELEQGALRRLSECVGAQPEQVENCVWHGPLVIARSPICEAVSPVSLPSSRASNDGRTHIS